MSSYTLQKFSVEKYGSSALKCRVGRLHTILSNCFTFKSRIYMQKPQNAVGSVFSGYPARLSTSYISFESLNPELFDDMVLVNNLLTKKM